MTITLAPTPVRTTTYTLCYYLQKQPKYATIDITWGYLRKDEGHASDTGKILDTERGSRTLQGVRRNGKEAHQRETLSGCQIWQPVAHFGGSATTISRQPSRQKISAGGCQRETCLSVAATPLSTIVQTLDNDAHSRYLAVHL